MSTQFAENFPMMAGIHHRLAEIRRFINFNLPVYTSLNC